MASKIAPSQPQTPHGAPQDPPEPPPDPLPDIPGAPQEPSRTPRGSDLKIVLSLLLSCRRIKAKTSIEVVDHLLHNRNLHILATSSPTVDHTLDGGGGVSAQYV